MLRRAGMRPARADRRLELLGGGELAVGGARGARDVLVHQRPAEVVAAGARAGAAPPSEAELHPRGLDVVDQPVEGDPPDRVDQHHLVPGRPRAGLALQEDRRGHVDEGQRHELGEAAGAPLDLAQHLEVVGPGARPVDVADHHRRGRPQAELVGGDHHLGPLGGAHLVRAQVRAHAVVEDLGGRARQGAQAGVAQAGEELAHAHPEGVGALPDLERREAVDVHLGQALLDALEHRDVEVAGEVGVDAALQADLGGAPLPGLDRAVHHLVHVQDVGVAAQVEALGPAREAAEAAAEVALVGVVDVAVDDVGDRRRRSAAAQVVGDLGDRLDLAARGRGRGARSRPPAAACRPASARGSRARSGSSRAEALLGARPRARPRPPTRPTGAAPAPAAPRRARAPRCSAAARRPSRRPGRARR